MNYWLWSAVNPFRVKLLFIVQWFMTNTTVYIHCSIFKRHFLKYNLTKISYRRQPGCSEHSSLDSRVVMITIHSTFEIVGSGFLRLWMRVTKSGFQKYVSPVPPSTNQIATFRRSAYQRPSKKHLFGNMPLGLCLSLNCPVLYAHIDQINLL